MSERRSILRKKKEQMTPKKVITAKNKNSRDNLYERVILGRLLLMKASSIFILIKSIGKPTKASTAILTRTYRMGGVSIESGTIPCPVAVRMLERKEARLAMKPRKDQLCRKKSPITQVISIFIPAIT